MRQLRFALLALTLIAALGTLTPINAQTETQKARWMRDLDSTGDRQDLALLEIFSHQYKEAIPKLEDLFHRGRIEQKENLLKFLRLLDAPDLLKDTRELLHAYDSLAAGYRLGIQAAHALTLWTQFQDTSCLSYVVEDAKGGGRSAEALPHIIEEVPSLADTATKVLHTILRYPAAPVSTRLRALEFLGRREGEILSYDVRTLVQSDSSATDELRLASLHWLERWKTLDFERILLNVVPRFTSPDEKYSVSLMLMDRNSIPCYLALKTMADAERDSSLASKLRAQLSYYYVRLDSIDIACDALDSLAAKVRVMDSLQWIRPREFADGIWGVFQGASRSVKAKDTISAIRALREFQRRLEFVLAKPSAEFISRAACAFLAAPLGQIIWAISRVLKVPRDYPTIQSAINASRPWDIVVAWDPFDYDRRTRRFDKEDIVIRNKDTLYLGSFPSAEVRSVLIDHSRAIEFSGVHVSAEETGRPGIQITEGCADIVLDCEVEKAGKNVPAVSINGNCSRIRLVRSRIHDNDGDGVLIDGGGKGRVNVVNVSVFRNGGNGVRVEGGDSVYIINTFAGFNGLDSLGGGTGYGLIVGQGFSGNAVVIQGDMFMRNKGGRTAGAHSDLSIPKSLVRSNWKGNYLSSGDEGKSFSPVRNCEFDSVFERDAYIGFPADRSPLRYAGTKGEDLPDWWAHVESDLFDRYEGWHGREMTIGAVQP